MSLSPTLVRVLIRIIFEVKFIRWGQLIRGEEKKKEEKKEKEEKNNYRRRACFFSLIRL